jgi:8-hydroxy-5-deazaflavin:NADPH oxidoreductase
MKIAFIGIGNVGSAIAGTFYKKGHSIIIGSNNPDSESVKKALATNPAYMVKQVQQAVDASDIIFLATPFPNNKEALRGVRFHGKTLVDCTNPVGPPPDLPHSLSSIRSGSEMVQELAPDARVVKAFSIYGFENFSEPSFAGYPVKPVMLIAGDDAKAKAEVSVLIEEMGYLPKDAGKLSHALHLEHMTLLWVKMVRRNNHPGFVWAMLEKK